MSKKFSLVAHWWRSLRSHRAVFLAQKGSATVFRVPLNPALSKQRHKSSDFDAFQHMKCGLTITHDKSLNDCPQYDRCWLVGSRRDKQGGIRGPSRFPRACSNRKYPFGVISIGKHAAFRAVRSEGRRSSDPVAWHGSVLLILGTISPRDYESRTCRRKKQARVKTLFFDVAFAAVAPEKKRHDQIECLDRCSGGDSSNGIAAALENVQDAFCFEHPPLASNAERYANKTMSARAPMAWRQVTAPCCALGLGICTAVSKMPTMRLMR